MSKHQDLSNPRSLRSRIRRKRVRHLVEFVAAVVEREGRDTITIADVGGNYRYWDVFPFQKFSHIRFEITLINISERKIFAPSEVPNVVFRNEIGDACALTQIRDQAYDISHSNSVIEHVGDWKHVKMMRDELLRTGKYYFVQTPNYWFPVEPHYVLPFIHWLPRPWYVALLMRLRKNKFDQATENYDSHRMLSRREFTHLFPDARMITERFWLMAKSYIAVSRF